MTVSINEKLKAYKEDFTIFMQKNEPFEEVKWTEFQNESKTMNMFIGDEFDEYLHEMSVIEDEVAESFGKCSELLSNGEKVFINNKEN